jgi:hypothetical protein
MSTVDQVADERLEVLCRLIRGERGLGEFAYAFDQNTTSSQRVRVAASAPW